MALLGAAYSSSCAVVQERRPWSCQDHVDLNDDVYTERHSESIAVKEKVLWM